MGKAEWLVISLALATPACGGREAAALGHRVSDPPVIDAGGVPGNRAGDDGGDASLSFLDSGAVTDAAVHDAAVHDATAPMSKPFPPAFDDSGMLSGTGTCPGDGGPVCTPDPPPYVVAAPPIPGDLTQVVGPWVGCQFIVCSPGNECTVCSCLGTGGSDAPVWSCY
jgi:hypothetical protein